jgi:hypothetical protein
MRGQGPLYTPPVYTPPVQPVTPPPAPPPPAEPAVEEDPYAEVDVDASREYPPEGPDAYGAIADDLMDSGDGTEPAEPAADPFFEDTSGAAPDHAGSLEPTAAETSSLPAPLPIEPDATQTTPHER